MKAFIILVFFVNKVILETYVTGFDKPAYDELLQTARTAYNEDDHYKAASFFEKAISDYRHELEVKGQCWLKCQDSLKNTQKGYSTILDGQLNFLHFLIKSRSCFQLCKEKFIGRRGRIAKYVTEMFEKREPYSYLQYSYYKIGETNKALDAAYTHYEANQENSLMLENINILLSKQGRDWDSLRSLEELPHITLYKQGEAVYKEGKYDQCIQSFEESLALFYKELAKCNAVCEEQDGTREVSYSTSLFNHFRGILSCRRQCQVKMTEMKGRSSATHFVPYYFHYLQYCYFQVGNILEAAIAADSYLLMMPSDPVMSKNFHWYKQQKEVKGKTITPRPRAKKYMKQFAVELNLLNILDGYLDESNDEKEISKNDDILLDSVYKMVSEEIQDGRDVVKGEHDAINKVHTLEKAYRNSHRWREHLKVNHSVLLMEEKELNGTNRVAFDNVINEEECRQMMELVKTLAVSGDGYKHSHSDADHPFTKKEKFAGVTIKGAVEATKNGKVSVNQTELYVKLSERARLLTQEYFDMRKRLNFAFTHLVCRHALADAISDESEEHLSHPVHSDNCVVNGDGPGTCPERSPAYTWRDYSALLYLNGDFSGGQFIFADHDGKIQARVTPKCGRMVAFRSKGVENLHGVLGVKSGVRCALPIWFTLSDQRGHVEFDRVTAETELMRLKILEARGEKEEL